MLTGEYVRTGRDAIQGGYVAQTEINSLQRDQGELVDSRSNRCLKICLLIANSGGNDSSERIAYTGLAARMIANYKAGYTIKEVDDWPFSGQTADAQSVLALRGIPILSSTVSSTSLSGLSSGVWLLLTMNQSRRLSLLSSRDFIRRRSLFSMILPILTVGV